MSAGGELGIERGRERERRGGGGGGVTGVLTSVKNYYFNPLQAFSHL